MSPAIIMTKSACIKIVAMAMARVAGIHPLTRVYAHRDGHVVMQAMRVAEADAWTIFISEATTAVEALAGDNNLIQFAPEEA